MNIIEKLPKDKFVYEAGDHHYFPHLVTKTNYYHIISATSFFIT